MCKISSPPRKSCERSPVTNPAFEAARRLVHEFYWGRLVNYSLEAWQVYDLSQQHPNYYRTELKDGTMMALKTNTKLFSLPLQRMISPVELCSILVLPCNKKLVP